MVLNMVMISYCRRVVFFTAFDLTRAESPRPQVPALSPVCASPETIAVHNCTAPLHCLEQHFSPFRQSCRSKLFSRNIATYGSSRENECQCLLRWRHPPRFFRPNCFSC